MISGYAYSLKQPNSEAEILRETILALDITKIKSFNKLSTLDKIQDKTLYHEYTVFTEYLSFQINEYCQQLSENYGEASLINLPCYISKNGYPYQKETLDKNEYVTDEEKINSLDNEFMTALGNFDEMLLSEKEMIAQSSRKNNQSNASSGAKNSSNNTNNTNSSNKKSGSEQQSATQKNESKQNGQGKTQRSSSTPNKSAKNKPQRKNQNRKRLDQIDDDIVARQLKEAAEQETDAELKAKLWDEYYKYKQNTVK